MVMCCAFEILKVTLRCVPLINGNPFNYDNLLEQRLGRSNNEITDGNLKPKKRKCRRKGILLTHGLPTLCILNSNILHSDAHFKIRLIILFTC